MLYRAHLAWPGFELLTLVVMGTDIIGSNKSNYHTITTTTVPPTDNKETLWIWTKGYYNSIGIQFYRKGFVLLQERNIYSKGFNCDHSGQLYCKLYRFDFVILYYHYVSFIISLNWRGLIDCLLFLSVSRIF